MVHVEVVGGFSFSGENCGWASQNSAAPKILAPVASNRRHGFQSAVCLRLHRAFSFYLTCFSCFQMYSMIFLRCLIDRIRRLLRATYSWPESSNDAVSIANKRGLSHIMCKAYITYEQRSLFLKCMISFPPESLAGIMSCSTNSLPDLCRNIPPSTNPRK